MTYSINSDKTAAVSTDHQYQPMKTCPKGVKILAVSKHGVARLDIYNGQSDLIGWFPLPKIPREMK